MAKPALVDASIRHQVFLERLKAGEANKVRKFLMEMDRYLRQRLGGTEFQRNRVEAQLAQIKADLAAIRGDARRQLLTEMRDVAESEAAFNVRSLNEIVVNYSVAAPEQVFAAALAKPLSLRGPGGGKLIEPLLVDFDDRTVTRIIDTVRQGFFEGQTNASILKAIRGTGAARNEDGLLAQLSRQEEAIVRTTVQHFASVAKEEVYAANRDLVKRVQWRSTLDSRTTIQCASLDGQVFPVDEGPRPPIHINCRSTTVPVVSEGFEFLREGATRSSMDGPIDAKTTYYEWLKRQPAPFIDDTIGPTRGKLLRDGGLTAERFAELNIGRNFQPLTLAQMREREPLAFLRANL